MLSRLTARSLRLRFIPLAFSPSLGRLPYPPSPSQPPPPPPCFPPPCPFPRSTFFSNRAFSSDQRGCGGGGDDGGTWKLTTEADEDDSVFGEEEGSLSGITEGVDGPVGSEPSRSQVMAGDPWVQESAIDKKADIFDEIDRDLQEKGERGGDDEWETAEGYKPWTLGDHEEKRDVFGIGEGGEGVLEGIEGGGFDELEKDRIEEQQRLEKQEQELMTVLKGPNRAFGDLIAASGITEDMIDSLILLKDVRGIKGLPPLSEIEDKAIARMNETSSRAEIERKKQEEIAKARVRQVDEKGRAYGTGRRKCSVARVWIQPGDGKFIVNDKQFDAYFPILDHRADLLRPFTVTNTLGLWDVNSTVKGGGVSGQVGAVRLGISRALQNWEPGLRPYLKAAGYLTRDPRVVERKKPGKAKARKSFQWVKR